MMMMNEVKVSEQLNMSLEKVRDCATFCILLSLIMQSVSYSQVLAVNHSHSLKSTYHVLATYRQASDMCSDSSPSIIPFE